ncbi:MAG TPA: bifunctional phosphopantothenoylcysteine decarboxylase/phosphopantothenate--cysteine ligase CoaBC [Solirubrobacteraceae bacterium]
MGRLLLGVTGGIAAYKAVETARLAVGVGHAVRVIQTPASLRFIGQATFAAITGAPVLTSEFEADSARGTYPGERLADRAPISHLALVERAEAYLIAPASANTIAKLAHGIADNLLCTAALAAPCPIAVAPAMNHRMYASEPTQSNLRLLADRGITIIPPGEGDLASHGERGVGRLAEPHELLAAWEAMLGPGSLNGLHVLVSAGGTREPIDSVRYIGNRSSGRMGYALAGEAARRGAEVTVIAANVALADPPGATVTRVETAQELAAACEREFPSCDVLLMAAAVADFRPREQTVAKLKKDQGVPEIKLEPTVDVLATLAPGRRPGQVLVGFAAEHGEDAVSSARQKLERKGLDLLVVNDIARRDIGFDAAQNEVTIISASGERLVPRASKGHVARAVLDEVEHSRGSSREGLNGAGADARSAARV